VGIRDKELSRKLQLISNLTLEMTVQEARQQEEVKAQVSQQGEAAACAVEEVARGFSKFKMDERRNNETDQQRRRSERGNTCNRCGKMTHKIQEHCPAIKSTCNKCKKTGHWERVCKSKMVVNEVSEHEENAAYFLGSVKCTSSSSGGQWTVKLNICHTPVSFKIDTGADVCIMSEETFKSLSQVTKLHPAKAMLCSPGGQLNCIGQFTANVWHKDKKYSFRVYVVGGESVSNLLSRAAAQTMGLVKRICEVRGSGEEFGLLKTQPVQIALQEDAQPYAVHTARRVPIPLMKSVKLELDRMETKGVIERVTEPTDWCAPMVPAPKKSGQVRICVDLRKLNKAVKRERFVLPTTDEITAELSGSTVFSSLDAAAGFWQIPLDKDSQRLTTFITPFARYCFKRLPFGISSAPEIFQRKMVETLEGLPGTAVYMDDIIVHGKDMTQHDERLQQVMERLETAGLKLNVEKCALRQQRLNFLGHVIDADGTRPDPAKVSAINDLTPPTNVHELKRVLGMVNYLGKYIPNLAAVGQPMYELLKSKSVWTWGPVQQSAFQCIKELLTTPPTLAFYDVNKPTAVSADASSYGIGGVLMQLHSEGWKPVAYCSRRLSGAETRYAQIEKECLASVWTCERFGKYLHGLEGFRLITDHKPLVPLMNSKDLDTVPIRCQRLLMRLMRFNPTAEYAPGKTLVTADALSRSPVGDAQDGGDTNVDVECYVASIINNMPATERRMDSIRAATVVDDTLQAVTRYIQSGWPDHVGKTHPTVREFFPMRNELSIHQGLVIRGNRIVIPETLRADVLERIHDGHQGLTKCRDRANSAVWWPGISAHIKQKVSACQPCQEQRRAQSKEPLISTPLPDRPWKRIGMDLCEYNKQNYLVISDYYSRFIEILHMPTTTTVQVVTKLKATFARYGVADEVVSDNGPQFSSEEFKQLARELDFTHVTSSPHHPQGNGHAERAVQIAKGILRQKDPLLALMCYRSTPCSSTGVSPAELLMGRKIRTTLPTLESNLQPRRPNKQSIAAKDASEKRKQTYYYNQRHGVRNLPTLRAGDHVLTRLDHQKSWVTPAVVTGESITPRSYLVETEQGARLRRNRRHLQVVPSVMSTTSGALGPPPEQPSSDPGRSPTTVDTNMGAVADGLTQTRSGRVSRPVQRLDL
jgi:transposase InsO family protein